MFSNITMKSTYIEQTQEPYAAYLAIDWADEKHDFALQVPGQTKKETGTLEQKPEAIGAWMAQLRERFGGKQIAVGVEQSRGALIHALLNYDFIVIYPLHPLTVSNFREAFKFSGVKSDPLDTKQILEILTKHRELLRPLNPDTEETRLLARLVEDRRKMVDQRTSHIEALGAALKEYYPQALEVLSGNLSSRLACDFLTKWPAFESFQHAKPSTIKRFFYGHNVRSPQVIEKVLKVAQNAKALTTDLAIVESGRHLAQSYAQMISTLNPIIEDYEERIQSLFNAHPEAYLFNKLPGAGPAMAPRLLAFFGTDRSRYQTAQNVQSFSGVAPTTRTSGNSSYIYMRRACPKFERQTFHEFSRLSVRTSQWAANYVKYYTDKGKSYQTIIRALAFKWIRILFRCWKNQTPYNEEHYMATLIKRGSIFATLHLKTPKHAKSS
ncbi:MAG: IS110 family transposase [Ktedonobacteraceae bacterium]|nr:IS110 family transposase [Ktedonobacteraceae bacterium]